MIADNSGWGSRFFPEIKIYFRSPSPTVLSPRVQVVLLSVLTTGVAALVYLGIGWLGHEQLAAKKEVAAARANDRLEKQIDGLQASLAALTHDRDEAERRAAAMADQAGTLRNQLASSETKRQSLERSQNQLTQQRDDVAKQLSVSGNGVAAKENQIGELTQTLDQTRQALQQEQSRSAALTAQLGKIQADRVSEETQLTQFKQSLEQTAKELDELGRVRSKRSIPGARFHIRLGAIWQKLSQIQLPFAHDIQAAGSMPSAARGIDIADFGRREAAAFEHALRSAGVDVTQIFSKFGAEPGEGGPFVVPPKAGAPAAGAVSPEKLAAIESLAKTLPVSAPLAQYEINSPFGPRIDPFNHRVSFHTGIDLDAPYSSAVYATAPGIVIYSGWLVDYGNVVEIDHGLGIVTLYAHLRRCLVGVGQNIPAHGEIGLVGTTGRSTGPHVHYEVRVDGQPQDPEKFLALARLLPAPAPQVIPAAGGPAGSSR